MKHPIRDHGCASYRRVTRRAFLGGASATGAAAFLGLEPALLVAAPDKDKARAKSVIFLWMAGGQSHLDTWDPKPGTATGGTFGVIPTAVKDIRISEHLPQIAGEFNDIALVRSLTAKEGNHERATYIMHTGYLPLGSFQHSTLGSVAAKVLASETEAIPPYITINGNAWAAGHLGSGHAPFHIGSATEPARNLTYHDAVDEKRFRRRVKLLQSLDPTFVSKHRREEVIRAYAGHYNAAYRMMSSQSARAFDLSAEKPAARESYGMTQFGQGCLLARRLVEVGVRFVEVTLGGWDTHQDNFERVADLSGTLDQGVAALIKDLRKRELLHQTVVVLLSEFGRTPKINENTGRDHWPKVWSAMLAGGGIAGGRVVGASSPDGAEVKDRPVQPDEIHATLCTLLGIDFGKRFRAPDGRPIRIIPRKNAEPVTELMG